jgi:hypothetical protein
VKKLLGTNNTLFGTNKTIIDTTGGSNYLARGHLAPDANFIYNVEQVRYVHRKKEREEREERKRERESECEREKE